MAILRDCVAAPISGPGSGPMYYECPSVAGGNRGHATAPKAGPLIGSFNSLAGLLFLAGLGAFYYINGAAVLKHFCSTVVSGLAKLSVDATLHSFR